MATQVQTAATLRRFVRWSTAAPWPTLRLRERAAAATPDRAPSLGLVAGLRRWRSRLQLRRAGIVVRRQLIVALAVAVIAQVLVAAGAIEQTVAIGVAAAALAGGLVYSATRPFSLDAVARLLDDRLGLFDRLGTALSLERRPGRSRAPLERRAIADGSATIAVVQATWRPAGPAASREWAALAGVLGLLVLVVAIVPGAGDSGVAGSARHGSAAAVGSSAAAASNRTGSARAGAFTPARTAASRPAGGAQTSPIPRVTNPYGGPSAGYHTPSGPSLTYAGGLHQGESVNVPRAPAQRTPDVGAPGSTPGGRAGSAGSSTGKAQNFVGVGSSSTQGAISPVNPSAGQSAGDARQAPKGASAEPGAAAPARGAVPGSRPAASSTSTASGGTPSGSATAGHQKGGTELASSAPARGQATHDLALQAGYAPVRSGQATQAGRAGNGAGGGGGPGRSTAVSGGTGAGGFGYVPSDRGPAASPDTALLLNYAASLSWIRQQRW